jgi:hypothetical protein
MYAGGLADQIQDVEWEDLFEDEFGLWFLRSISWLIDIFLYLK